MLLQFWIFCQKFLAGGKLFKIYSTVFKIIGLTSILYSLVDDKNHRKQSYDNSHACLLPWLATTGKRMCGNVVLLVGFPCFKRGKTDWQSSIYPKYLNGMACVPGFVYIFKFSSLPTLGFPNLKPQHTNWQGPTFPWFFQGPTFPTRFFSGTHFSKVFPPRI